MERNPKLVRALEQVLEEEAKLSMQYAEILEEEKNFLIKFDPEKVSALSAKRNLLGEEMRVLQEKRKELIKDLPDSGTLKLTELINKHFHPDDAKRLLPRAFVLKESIKKARHSSAEFQQIVNFSLNLVNGSLSILWSVTQHVTKSYSSQGRVKESFCPVGSRYSGVLKQA